MKRKKILALLILFVMSALLLFSGCSGKQEDADEKADGKNEAGGHRDDYRYGRP